MLIIQDQQLSRVRQEKDDLEFHSPVIRIFRFSCLLLYGYIVGHLGLSVWWIWIASVFLVHSEQRIFGCHIFKTKSFWNKLQTEENLVVERLAKYFPDCETANWANHVVRQLWPFMHEKLAQMLRTQVEQNINDSLPDLFKGFRFGPINFGNAVSDILINLKHVFNDF